MATVNRRLVLAERPRGMVDEQTLRLEESPMPVPGDGEAVVRVRYLSIDPTIRGWMNDAPGYLPPIGIGEVVRGFGAGEVVESRSDRYPRGAVVAGMTGWQEYVVADAAGRRMDPLPDDVPLPLALDVLGVTGLTAYFGLLDVGRLREGQSLVVSGAAGATGSVVGQLGRLHGASPVIGIAGTQEKCARLVNELGFDVALDYHRDDVARRLREILPDGIDLYWDNVGGPLLDVALARLALHGTVVVCGAISGYNDEGPPAGPRNYLNLITRRGRMEGFLVLDYAARFDEGRRALGRWVSEGRIATRQEVLDGLDRAPEALNLLFTGGNTGKVLVALP